MRICLLLKTHQKDRDLFLRCLGSIREFNASELTLFVVVPRAEYSFFESMLHVTRNEYLIPQEAFTETPSEIKSLHGNIVSPTLAVAYASRLAFAQLSIAEHYFTIDSDFLFIRPFYEKDFFDSQGRPIWAAEQWSELQIDLFYFSRYWKFRAACADNVRAYLGHESTSPYSAHGGVVINTAALLRMKNEVLIPRGLNFADLVILSDGYDFLWYDQWVYANNKGNSIHGERRNELVKYVHHQGQHLSIHFMGTTLESLGRAFIGVNLNSNWSRQYGKIEFDSPPVQTYLEKGDWQKSFFASLPGRLPRHESKAT